MLISCVRILAAPYLNRGAESLPAPHGDQAAVDLSGRIEEREMGEKVSVECCVVGGGPAGMLLGLLLARAGVQVVVLEKHADFLRDFRGDRVHPSTLRIMPHPGLLES